MFGPSTVGRRAAWPSRTKECVCVCVCVDLRRGVSVSTETARLLRWRVCRAHGLIFHPDVENGQVSRAPISRQGSAAPPRGNSPANCRPACVTIQLCPLPSELQLHSKQHTYRPYHTIPHHTVDRRPYALGTCPARVYYAQPRPSHINQATTVEKLPTTQTGPSRAPSAQPARLTYRVHTQTRSANTPLRSRTPATCATRLDLDGPTQILTAGDMDAQCTLYRVEQVRWCEGGGLSPTCIGLLPRLTVCMYLRTYLRRTVRYARANHSLMPRSGPPSRRAG